MGLFNVQGKKPVAPSTPTIRFPNGVVVEPYTNILLFIGRKMSGKSFAAKYYTQPINRLIVWDYNWEHTDKQVVHTISGLEAAWLSQSKVKRIAYQPENKQVGDFDAFCSWVVSRVRYCNIVVEELYQVANTATIADPKKNIAFKTIVGSGRHDFYRLGLTCTERRLQGLPPMITGNADHFFIFKQQKKEDWDLIESYADKSKVDELRSAPRYSYIYIGYDKNHEGNAILMPPVGKRFTTRRITQESA